MEYSNKTINFKISKYSIVLYNTNLDNYIVYLISNDNAAYKYHSYIKSPNHASFNSSFLLYLVCFLISGSS